jgi:two-component system CheB/CheR fusion protein
MDKIRPFRVLIVEDDRDSAITLAALLRAIGYAVEVVLTAPDTILCIHTFAPHVVLLDIAMPVINGYELAKAIRAEPGFESVPLIVLSGYGDDAHKQQSIAAGINHHLVKPVEFSELETLLADELRNLAPVSQSVRRLAQ